MFFWRDTDDMDRFPMEDCFHHGIKMGIAIYYLTMQTFYLTILNLYLAILT